MANEVMIYEAEQAIAKTSGTGYKVKTPMGGEVTLKRDVDFGVIPGTKSPSLYKSGAEKVCMAYGLLQHYTTESKIEQFSDKGCFFYYLVKCELVKIANDGREYVFATGYGSANTAEKRNGRNTGPDAINSSVKMAQKRSLVSAALSISGLSDMFTQDIEDERFMQSASKTMLGPNDPLTREQLVRLFSIAGNNGYTKEQVRQKVNEYGIKSTKDITQKEYDAICNLFENAHNSACADTVNK